MDRWSSLDHISSSGDRLGGQLMNRLETLTRRQFSLSGMVGYITVFSVMLAIPLSVVRCGCDLVFTVFVGLVCLIGLAAIEMLGLE